MDNLHERLQWKNGRTLTRTAYMRSLQPAVEPDPVATNDRQPYLHLVRLHPTGPRLVKVNPQERCQ
jgi:hypothetical protein